VKEELEIRAEKKQYQRDQEMQRQQVKAER
jgi:hypothetical protein